MRGGKKWLYGNVHPAERKKKADANPENVTVVHRTAMKRKTDFF
jgi:hypothetical protein